MKFCLLNDNGFERGAGIAHRRMGDALKAAGHEVQAVRFQPLSAQPGKNQPTVEELVDSIAATGCDIVILGNVHYARPEAFLFEEVFRRWPTLVVVHDFWWLTGRCAYTNGCRKLDEGCDSACPTANEYPVLDPEDIAGAWLQKRHLLRNFPNAVLVANSDWTRKVIEEADVVPPNRVQQFRIGMEPTCFARRDRATARIALGLPPDAFIVMMSTTAINDPRKGAMPIIDLLAELGFADLRLMILGYFTPEQRGRLPEFCLLPGYIDDRERLLLHYAAADVIVGGSREETFGQVFAEAGAVGTPVVAYGATGLKDAVADQFSGLLAASSSPAELVRLILTLRARPAMAQSLGEIGPIHFANEYSMEASYHSIFQALDGAGLIDRFGIRRNISFVINEHRAVMAAEKDISTRTNATRDGAKTSATGWTPIRGVSWREQAIPGQGITLPFNWFEGPESEILVETDASGTHLLIFEYQNPLFDAQSISLNVNGVSAGEKSVGRTMPHRTGLLSIGVELRKGDNRVTLSFGKSHKPEGDGRNLALIVNNIVTFAR